MRFGFLCFLLLIESGMVFASEPIAAPCSAVVAINLDDDLAEDDQATLWADFQGRCIDGELLKAVVAHGSAYYMQQGKVTTRAYLKPQDIQDGKIEVSVLKGMLTGVVDGYTQQTNSRLKFAFAFQQGAVLNLRDLETALEMMNRVPSVDVTFDIIPGDEQGESMVAVQGQDSSPYHFKLGMSGQKKINDDNPYLTAEFSWDNPFDINDILTLRYNGSRIQEAYQGNTGSEVNYSFPIGSYLTELVWSTVAYRQGVSGLNDTYLAAGETKSTRLKVSKVMFRNQQHKLNTSLSMYHKDTQNYFSDVLVDVSSYKTTLVQLDLSHTLLQSWGQLTTAYGYYQGVDWFGARGDNHALTAGNQAKLLFHKHSFDMSVMYGLTDKSYQLSSNFHQQYTADKLYDHDKQSVGSGYTVRGYASANLFGNNAWYLKNDFTKSWAVDVSPSLLSRVSGFVGLDYGEVGCEADNQGSCGKIYGMATGLNSYGSHVTTGFIWSRPLKALSPSFQAVDLFSFNMNWSF